MITVFPERPAKHADAIEHLYDRTFGPGHFAKTAERLREGTVSLPDLSRVALHGDKVIGACRIWPIEIGAARVPSVFVGPVAIDPDFQGQRLGLTVTGEALEAIERAGWSSAVIIGSPTYFSELGFEQAQPGQLTFPGPQDQARVMLKRFGETNVELTGAVRVPANPSTYL